MTVRTLPWIDPKDPVVDLSEDVSTHQILKKFDLDWNIGLHPLHTSVYGIDVPIHGKYALIREDLNTVMSVVSSRYSPIDNIAAFDFLDDAFTKDILIPSYAGSLRNSAIVYIASKYNASQTSSVDIDFDYYVLTLCSHDSSFKPSFQIVPIARNSFVHVPATFSKNAAEKEKINYNDPMKSLSDYIKKYVSEQQTMLNHLLMKDIEVDSAENLLRMCIPKHVTKKDEAVERIMDTYLESPNNEFQDNCLGLYFGLCEFLDFDNENRRTGRENKMLSNVLGGGGIKMREAFLKRAL